MLWLVRFWRFSRSWWPEAFDVGDISALRKATDLSKLRELQARMPQTLEILRVEGTPPRLIALRIRIPTAKSPGYPAERQDISDVTIELPDRYPLPPGPTVYFQTPIWNPNVFEHAQRWCYGEWTIAENLELFVIRLMRVIALDPSIVNPQSPANSTARDWFVQLRQKRPELFPTVVVSTLTAPRPTMTWRDLR